MTKKVEFLIVGQGLAGTLLAFEMFKNKVSFRILASPEKSRASAVAAGMVNPLVFKRLTKSWMVDDLLPVMLKTYSELEGLLGEQLYFKKEIVKPLSAQEKLLWLERKEKSDFSNYIDSVEEFSGIDQLVKAAAYGRVKNAGYLNLSLFLKVSEQFFRGKSLFIEKDFDFKPLNPKTGELMFDHFVANQIVFCEGYHIIHNPLFQFVKMNPTKGEVLQIHAPGLSEEFILNKKVFVLPVGNQQFKVGSTYDWKELSDFPTEKGKLSILERLDNLITADYTIESHWAGVRPTVIDRRPILGIHPIYPNISVFNGLGTKGVMLAPWFAKEMLALLTSRDHSINAEVNVSRFQKG